MQSYPTNPYIFSFSFMLITLTFCISSIIFVYRELSKFNYSEIFYILHFNFSEFKNNLNLLKASMNILLELISFNKLSYGGNYSYDVNLLLISEISYLSSIKIRDTTII